MPGAQRGVRGARGPAVCCRVPDTGLAAGSYCMDASFMLLVRHGWDIHAVWPGAGV